MDEQKKIARKLKQEPYWLLLKFPTYVWLPQLIQLVTPQKN